MARHKMHCIWWGWGGGGTLCQRPRGIWASVIESDHFEILATIPDARDLLCLNCLRALESNGNKEPTDD